MADVLKRLPFLADIAKPVPSPLGCVLEVDLTLGAAAEKAVAWLFGPSGRHSGNLARKLDEDLEMRHRPFAHSACPPGMRFFLKKLSRCFYQDGVGT